MKLVSSIAVVVAMLFVGCSESDSKGEEAKTSSVQNVIDSATQKTKNIVEEVKEGSVGVVEDITSKSSEMMKEVQSGVVQKAQEVKEELSDGATQIKDDVKDSINSAALSIEAQTNKGANLYKPCAACHGAKGEKAALNSSKVIQGWDAQKIADSLNGYKNNTYGGSMKALMKGQVAKLSDDDINELATYISQLK